jgi:excisionase family DNA binding protein
MPDYLNIQEVADLTRAPVETVRYWRKTGTGPKAFKVGRRVLYRRADVEAWIQQQYEAAR